MAKSLTGEEDLEKSASSANIPQAGSSPQYAQVHNVTAFLKMLASWGVEVRGIQPVPVEERTKDNYANMFFHWCTMLLNLLPIVTGMTATLSYGLSLRDASLVIVFFNILCFLPTAYLATLGGKTGLRQMVQSRYSFGLYGNILIVLLNMASIVGFLVISAIISGQTLSSVSGGNLSLSAGIVLTGLLGLLVSFFGYRVIHIYNRYSWAVVLTAIVIAVGCGGHHLHQQVPEAAATAPVVLDFGCVIAGFSLSSAGLMSDYTVYYRPDLPGKRMFWYVFCGQSLPTIILMILGAAIGGAVPNVPDWQAGYDADSSGGVLAAMLHPAGGFGNFVTVILAFSLIGNVGASMYTVTLNFQVLLPFLVRVPRVVWAAVTTAIIIPVSIKAAASFFDSLENFLGIISYWPGAWVAIVILEHLYFRKGDAATYNHRIWDSASELPSGVAALTAGLLSFAVVIPSMDDIWFTGPIAKTTGDIGFEVACAISTLLYIPFRTLEIQIQGRSGSEVGDE